VRNEIIRIFGPNICDGFQHLSFMLSQKKKKKRKSVLLFQGLFNDKTDLSLQQ
jgi:hypothetical protein